MSRTVHRTSMTIAGPWADVEFPEGSNNHRVGWTGHVPTMWADGNPNKPLRKVRVVIVRLGGERPRGYRLVRNSPLVSGTESFDFYVAK